MRPLYLMYTSVQEMFVTVIGQKDSNVSNLVSSPRHCQCHLVLFQAFWMYITYVHVNYYSEENSWAGKNLYSLHCLRGHFRRSWDVLTVKPKEVSEREKTKCCMKVRNFFSAPAPRLKRRERVFASFVNIALLTQSCVLSISRSKLLRLPSIMIIKWGDRVYLTVQRWLLMWSGWQSMPSFINFGIVSILSLSLFLFFFFPSCFY